MPKSSTLGFWCNSCRRVRHRVRLLAVDRKVISDGEAGSKKHEDYKNTVRTYENEINSTESR